MSDREGWGGKWSFRISADLAWREFFLSFYGLPIVHHKFLKMMARGKKIWVSLCVCVCSRRDIYTPREESDRYGTYEMTKGDSGRWRNNFSEWSGGIGDLVDGEVRYRHSKTFYLGIIEKACEAVGDWKIYWGLISPLIIRVRYVCW